MSLLAFTFGQWIVGSALVLICGLLILVILVQQASGGGLVGAFGGGGGGGAFGAKTGDVFTVITCALAGLFLILAVSGNYIFVPYDVPVSPAVASSPTPPLGGAAPLPVPPTEGVAGDDAAPAGAESTGGEDAATDSGDPAPAETPAETDSTGSGDGS